MKDHIIWHLKYNVVLSWTSPVLHGIHVVPAKAKPDERTDRRNMDKWPLCGILLCRYHKNAVLNYMKYFHWCYLCICLFRLSIFVAHLSSVLRVIFTLIDSIHTLSETKKPVASYLTENNVIFTLKILLLGKSVWWLAKLFYKFIVLLDTQQGSKFTQVRWPVDLLSGQWNLLSTGPVSL